MAYAHEAVSAAHDLLAVPEVHVRVVVPAAEVHVRVVVPAADGL